MNRRVVLRLPLVLACGLVAGAVSNALEEHEKVITCLNDEQEDAGRLVAQGIAERRQIKDKINTIILAQNRQMMDLALLRSSLNQHGPPPVHLEGFKPQDV